MGMGGAFVALSDDENALVYNPAGLAQIATPRFILPLPEISFNSKALDIYTDAADTDFDDVTDTADFLRAHMGETGYTSLAIFPAYVKQNFGFGVIGKADMSLGPENPVYPLLHINATQNGAACAGFARSLAGGNLLAGVGAKYVFRRSIDRGYTVSQITSGDFEDTVRNDFEEGSGFLLDLGVIYKVGGYRVADTPGTVQAGASVSNLVGGRLGDARDLDTHVDLGIATHIGDKLTLALDYTDVAGRMGDDDDAGKRIHAGIEYRLAAGVTLRTGLNQGYPTFGIGLASKRAVLDIASYAEETGTYAGQKDDRRYMARLGIVF